MGCHLPSPQSRKKQGKRVCAEVRVMNVDKEERGRRKAQQSASSGSPLPPPPADCPLGPKHSYTRFSSSFRCLELLSVTCNQKSLMNTRHPLALVGHRPLDNTTKQLEASALKSEPLAKSNCRPDRVGTGHWGTRGGDRTRAGSGSGRLPGRTVNSASV